MFSREVVGVVVEVEEVLDGTVVTVETMNVGAVEVEEVVVEVVEEVAVELVDVEVVEEEDVVPAA